MKKFFVLLLFILNVFEITAQPLRTVNLEADKVFVLFQRADDGVFVSYKLKSGTVVTDGLFAKGINSDNLELGEFYIFPKSYPNLNQAREALGLQNINALIPVEKRAIETPKPVIENYNFDKSKYIKIRDYIDPQYRDIYLSKYADMLKNAPNGEPKIIIEFPSNTISYHERGEHGAIIYSTVSLYDESGRLLIQSTGEGAIAGTNLWGNNHGAYYLFPEGKYRVVISNDGNNGKSSQPYILAEAFRQDQNSSGAYFDFGQPKILETGQSKEYWLECFDRGQPSLLFKINNVSRWSEQELINYR